MIGILLLSVICWARCNDDKQKPQWISNGVFQRKYAKLLACDETRFAHEGPAVLDGNLYFTSKFNGTTIIPYVMDLKTNKVSVLDLDIPMPHGAKTAPNGLIIYTALGNMTHAVDCIHIIQKH
jgi:hypothetical protein